MASLRDARRENDDGLDLWSQIAAPDNGLPQMAVTYRRRVEKKNAEIPISRIEKDRWPNRLSLAPNKRISWNRSLSTRGRTSIIISSGVDYDHQPRQKEAKRKQKRAPLNKTTVHPPNFEKERAYFQEVDSLELLEESPSPKHLGTWVMGIQSSEVVLPHLPSRLEKWLISKKFNYSCGPSGSLAKILETPIMPMESICSDVSNSTRPKEQVSPDISSDFPSISNNVIEGHTCSQTHMEGLSTCDDNCEDIGQGLKNLSLISESETLDGDHKVSFATLLTICGQLAPSTLLDVFSQYCDPNSIIKIGEGTYGEAFKVGATVCKIVPIDGDFRVNGEVQKVSAELLEEVLLCQTLNRLRRHDGHVSNASTAFIETLNLKVCQGVYDASLIRAWEDWDEEHGSENDHPGKFPEKQCYVVFVLEHGGKDLESFVLLNFDEARSLLVQVAAALAVAEAAYEFEHRDLHWGNILLTRKDDETVEFTLEGRRMSARTFGLSISIIDFTLSRMNNGEAVLFLDLSSDPLLFEGPKGDQQAETYRKMKEVTQECWEGR
ncbi:PREDICTED: serine/threonine-protein kinase haspin homolog isoform X2 [Nelumbo nucifera]|uniref:Serine/threonine-protein kinase haspin homolog isoform X2 n=1 Tax=Nelumbo nucifera TaxID=4432 RepID=A0A1U8QA32_NELNU|nr:PREDICTED: serine/threonine-protein kinase haspin homolog isoform X2 [Nelumbo nucifera]